MQGEISFIAKNVSKIFSVVVSQELTFGDNYT